jgi:ankyrin repeat protein
MTDFRSMARDPERRRVFEKLLYVACRRGDADLVAQRLSWAIDPNCTFAKGRTPLIGNVKSFCPSAATVRALLEPGADPHMSDERGLTALDYARRKLARLQARPRRRRAR